MNGRKDDELGVAPVLAQFPAARRATSVSRFSGGGLSGAQLWRVETPLGGLCLRRWPAERPDRQRLAWIHAVQRHVVAQGVSQLPRLQETDQGQTIALHGGRLWELTTWLPGKSTPAAQWTGPAIHSAVQLLARFHLAAATFPAEDEDSTSRLHGQASTQLAPLPFIALRLHQADLAAAGDAAQYLAIARRRSDPLAQQLIDILPRIALRLDDIRQMLKAAAGSRAALQPCLRDVWYENVLLDGGIASGLVDLDALRIETVAVDLARLLGSLLGRYDETWQVYLNAYEMLRPLTADERSAIRVCEESAAVLSGLNWARWLLVEERQFPSTTAVVERLQAVQRRLA